MKYYLIGIKGTGMIALAQVLIDLGHYVIGSDTSEYFYTNEFIKDKIECFVFDEKNIIDETYTYISSSCYGIENPEVKKVKELGFRFYYYHEFLAFFFEGIKIGISGAHGKTTTTSFITDMFSKEKCVSIIGDGRGKGVKDYKYFIFEACEYKDHILSYDFDYLIINNIDKEHLDYFQEENNIIKTFTKASYKAKTLICHESVAINHPNKYSFGQKKENYCSYEIIKESKEGYDLLITIDNYKLLIRFPYHGIHMINNLLASITTYFLCTHDIKEIQIRINSFKKIKRRMEEYQYKDNILIDDYAHHPTEIKALIYAINQKYPDKKLYVIFQPHTYSRTFTLRKEFEECFLEISPMIDGLYLCETFTSKREEKNFIYEKEVQSIFRNSNNCDCRSISTNSILDFVKGQENSVIVFLGAGIINKYIKNIINNENV